jgi:ADP-ribose pyrophosphatase
MSQPRITQLSTREIYRNQWLSLREDEVRFPDGSRGIYSVIDKSDFVIVVPWSDGGFWLVQQYRYPVGRREWEFPQGGWPTGHGGTQEELAAAELREETGLRAATLTHLGRLHSAYGFASQGFDTYLATDLTPGPPEREPTESDMIHEWRSEAGVRAMITAGEFADAHSVAALALFDQHRASA